MLLDAVNSGNHARIGASTVERDTEGIIYICRPVKADGKSRVRAEAQIEQVVVDQNAIRLNGAATHGGQAVRKTLEERLKNVSWEKKRFTAVKDDGKWVLLVLVKLC
jgi:hypothetical protein